MHQMTIRPLLLSIVISTLCVGLAQSASLGDATSRDGCLNQWLFNGVWRVEVTKVEPYMNGSQQTGWQVTEVWRNGTSQQLAPGDSFLDDQRLELSSGAITAKESSTGTLSMGGVGNNTFAPAGQFTYKQIFVGTSVDPSNKPKGLAIVFDAAKLAQMKSRPQFTSGHYNFHFKLDCVASGAAAQAEGGSTQLNATEGCLNQWMSNGIWKMRVTGIEPGLLSPDDPSSEQIGWRVTQEWTNATSRSLFPGDLPSGPILETNVTDEYLVTQSGNNASSANTVGNMGPFGGHEFAPGATFTFKQLFGWSPFDKTDKPTRLLVTFDAKKQNALAGHPHYHMPANFRINLECSK